jgi:hypothetical protein
MKILGVELTQITRQGAVLIVVISALITTVFTLFTGETNPVSIITTGLLVLTGSALSEAGLSVMKGPKHILILSVALAIASVLVGGAAYLISQAA